MRRPTALFVAAFVTIACAKGKEPEKLPLGAASATSQPPAMGEALSGTLLESISASPYVYLRLKTANGDVWAAVNDAKLEKGVQVTVYNSMLMEKFESKSLKRTFDQIYLGSLTPPNAPSAGGAPGAPSVGAPPAVDAKVGKVEKASGADARTVGELWAQKDGMAGKNVTLRGVVVKYNAGVMGKNWIHLQDGSGDAANGTHDLTVTSMDAATPGATVTVTGTVRTNKDFGAGYSYALIVEEAKVVKK